MAKAAEIKTKPTDSSVEDYIESLTAAQQREDSRAIIKMMEKSTKEKPQMWGKAMIGFGNVRYKSPNTGRQVDWFKIGFAPRKSNLSLHLINIEPLADELAKLGKHKTGMGCVYINKLADVDIKVLDKIIKIAANNFTLPTEIHKKSDGKKKS